MFKNNETEIINNYQSLIFMAKDGILGSLNQNNIKEVLEASEFIKMQERINRERKEIVLEEKKDVLSIPKNAVYYAGDKAYVYYFDEEGNRQIKSITVGLQADSRVEVLEGLTEGEEVILR